MKNHIEFESCQRLFPSPCGERVLLNAARTFQVKLDGVLTFPSPCGERVLLNANLESVGSAATCILGFPSPCGERVLLNDRNTHRFTLGNFSVSVPLRGKGSVEHKPEFWAYYADYDWVFPSPCGERVLLNAALDRLSEVHISSEFPSPCGERVLLNTEATIIVDFSKL